MSWFKVDDQLHGHPKARRAGLEAMGLWVVAGSHGTAYKFPDGFCPTWFVESWPNGPMLAEKLMRAGLWESAEVDGERGWTFHDWDDVQPTPEQIEQQREKSRERQRRSRETKKAREERAKAAELRVV